MIDSNQSWFYISNTDEIDSPALVIYPERIKENIRLLTARVTNISYLRPHVKTHKMAAVCQLQLAQGITKFKCATIAEAEMLAIEKAPDVLLAYQPAGPKIKRLIRLIKTYPATLFSCLADNIFSAGEINSQCVANGIKLNIFIDINAGMNRTGIDAGKAVTLFQDCIRLSNINIVGIHVYDGHVNDTDMLMRQTKSDLGFLPVQHLAKELYKLFNFNPVIIWGGSPSFATHLLRENAELSPGTFVFWDWGYKHSLPEEPYQYAALVISRVISIVDEHTVCTDLGHKAVAAETPLPRVHFLNAPAAIPVSQSEEHLLLSVTDAAAYKIGAVLYGVPVHICPTVALYERAIIIENNKATDEWKIVARDRKISI